MFTWNTFLTWTLTPRCSSAPLSILVMGLGNTKMEDCKTQPSKSPFLLYEMVIHDLMFLRRRTLPIARVCWFYELEVRQTYWRVSKNLYVRSDYYKELNWTAEGWAKKFEKKNRWGRWFVVGFSLKWPLRLARINEFIGD